MKQQTRWAGPFILCFVVACNGLTHPFRPGENALDAAGDRASTSDDRSMMDSSLDTPVVSEPSPDAEIPDTSTDVVSEESSVDVMADIADGRDTSDEPLPDVVSVEVGSEPAEVGVDAVDVTADTSTPPDVVAMVDVPTTMDVSPDGGCSTGQLSCPATGGMQCVDPTTNRDHCGRCNNQCLITPHSVVSCSGGMCLSVCETGWGNCDREQLNGCEANLATDSANCGACGTACMGGRTCQMGMCACPAGTFFCGGSCQAETASRCGAGCTDCSLVSGRTCQAGMCACPTGQVVCGTSCQSEGNSRCGPSCTDCTPSGRVCTAGSCVCPSGRVLCSGTCRSEDDNHCGPSCIDCPSGQRCRSGVCQS